MRNQNYYRPLALVSTFVLLILCSCNSPRMAYNYVASPTQFGKGYHNLTSRYNGYFNANIALMETEKELTKSYTDNFTQLLNVYPTLSSTGSATSANLDVIEEKTAVDITLHRDKSKWVDDLYLLYGNANLIAGDYTEAHLAYDYLIKNYNPDNPRKPLKKKKKKKKKRRRKRNKKNKKENKKAKEHPYFLKHKPAIYEAKLSKAKAFILDGKVELAQNLLEQLERDTLYKKIDKEIALAQAFAAIKSETPQSAYATVEKAIQENKNRHKRARLYYILGQLAQQKSDYALSNDYFDKSAKYKSSFDLDFNTKISKIQNRLHDGGDYEVAESEIKRMIRDKKNRDHLDQLYYSLAEIKREQDEYFLAEEYYIKSLEENTSNKIQKTEAYLALAELKYIEKEYSIAKKYYDSTLMNITENDYRIIDIEQYSENLSVIALKEDQVILNDSLIRIYGMSDEQQRLLASKLILEEEDDTPTQEVFNANTAVTSLSTFWAYNEKLQKKGERDFRKVWGERKLEDNWRVSNTGNFDDFEINDSPIDADVALVSMTEMSEIFAAVPKDGNGVTELEKSTEETLFELAKLYDNQLSDKESSIDAYKEILTRDKNTPQRAKVLYSIYRKYSELEDDFNALKYKNQLLKESPTSEYAILAKNPESLAIKQLSAKEQELTYLVASEAFQNQDFAKAKQHIDDLKKQDLKQYASKVYFLDALLVGKLKGEKAYKQALENIKDNYVGTEEAKTATQYLAYLNNQVVEEDPIAEVIKEEEQTVDKTYKFNKGERHFVMLQPYTNSSQAAKLRQQIIEYNKENYKKQTLFSSSATVGGGVSILLVRQFGTQEAAIEYLKFITEPTTAKEVFTPEVDFKAYIIGRSDFSKMLKTKGYDIYVKEYKEVYSF